MGYNSIAVSQLSLQYIGVPVNALTLDGDAYDPTADPVLMAFLPQATQVPQNSDWKTAIWATRAGNVLYPYAAYCLVGPGGTIILGTGTYYLYVKITGDPEIPIIRATTQLEIY